MMSRSNGAAQGLWRDPFSRFTAYAVPVRWALLPLAAIYGWVVSLRTALYANGRLSRRRLPCRVVSVGNLTTGGTGKTPVVIAIAQWLTSQGKRVAVLSRGYRRASRDEYLLVSDGARLLASPAEAGDEPHLIAKRCPGVVVAVGADRYRLGSWLLEQYPVDCVVLDDGFQHLGLQRDVDLLLMDVSDTAGLKGLLPVGRLREPIAAAARADAVLMTRAIPGSGHVPKALAGVRLKRRPYQVRFSAECLVHVANGAIVETDSMRNQRVMAVSGVGNPDSFRALLQDLDARVEDDMRFPDHHAYGAGDIERIRARAARAGVSLILTTEKDACKLEALVTDNDPIWAVRLHTEWTQGREELERLILGAD